jgi:integrase
MTPFALRSAVSRHHLDADGHGRKRRFPRATVEALQDRLCKGASVQTTNYYISHARSFGRWMTKNGRMEANRLEHLEPNSVGTDRRHDRRELTADEMQRLLTATRTNERPFRGLLGEDRFMLYATACGTGFRASALASLTPADFDLDADMPTVTLAARNSKNRKKKVQPLSADVADLLRNYLRGKPAHSIIWGGTWARPSGRGDVAVRP